MLGITGRGLAERRRNMGLKVVDFSRSGIEHWFGRWFLIGGDIATKVDGRWYRYSGGGWQQVNIGE